MTARERYADRAMAVLMALHPNCTRGWIAQRAWEMADVMVTAGKKPSVVLTPDVPFADTPRVFAEDEP